MQMAEIGRIVLHFSWLEFTVRMGIRSLTNLNQKDWEVLTAPLSFRQALDVLSSLYKLQHPKGTLLEAKLETLRKRAEAAEDARNEVVHSMWIPSKESGDLRQLRITARGKTGLRENVVEGRDISDVETLHSIAQELSDTNRALAKFLGLSKRTWLHFDTLDDLER